MCRVVRLSPDLKGKCGLVSLFSLPRPLPDAVSTEAVAELSMRGRRATSVVSCTCNATLCRAGGSKKGLKGPGPELAKVQAAPEICCFKKCRRCFDGILSAPLSRATVRPGCPPRPTPCPNVLGGPWKAANIREGDWRRGVGEGGE